LAATDLLAPSAVLEESPLPARAKITGLPAKLQRARVLPDNPAKGKVAAKVGTSIAVDAVSGRLSSKVQSLAGYLTLDGGRVLVFALR
jgi:hypothetical protein